MIQERVDSDSSNPEFYVVKPSMIFGPASPAQCKGSWMVHGLIGALGVLWRVEKVTRTSVSFVSLKSYIFYFFRKHVATQFVMHGDMPEEDESEICVSFPLIPLQEHWFWRIMWNAYFRAEVNVAHGDTHAWGVMRVMIMYGWTSASEWWRIWHQNSPWNLAAFSNNVVSKVVFVIMHGDECLWGTRRVTMMYVKAVQDPGEHSPFP